jgi:inhibitor of cysteine peptidase
MFGNRFATLFIIFMLGSMILAACAPTQTTTATTGPGANGNQAQVPTQPVVAPAVETKPTTAGEVQVTEQDAGKTFHLDIGQTLVVTLEGNPTTGYMWEMQPTDKAILVGVGDPEVKPESNLMGAGGKISLTFKAESEGQQILKLVYHRPWEKDVSPEKTFEVSVTVGQSAAAATPEAKQAAAATSVVYPANGLKGWQTYTNDTFGFSFQYPPVWKLEEGMGTMQGHAVLLRPNTTTLAQLQVVFKKASDGAQIGRTGLGSGELVLQGKVVFIGKEINREVLVWEGKHMTVRYICTGCMQRGLLVFGFDLDYLGNWNDPSALPADVEAMANLIVASVKLAD